MNWKIMRLAPWLDTRTLAVKGIKKHGQLLDIGTNNGSTLCHFYEMRPDLRFHAVDLNDCSGHLPPKCVFEKLDVTRDRLPFPDQSMDAVMALQLIEHLPTWDHFLDEVRRVLKPGGPLYLEFPGEKTVELPSPRGDMRGKFTFNFRDDLTHVHLPVLPDLTEQLAAHGFTVLQKGCSRNLLFAASYPLFYRFKADSYHKYTAHAHWLGWSSYLLAE